MSTARPTKRSPPSAPARWCEIVGRPERLERVVRNLLDNALRHAEDHVVISLSAAADVVHLAVEDDGPGIAPEDQARVFQRFVRLDDARSRDDGGAGLGLPLVDAIVRSRGGSISVEASPQLGGARFVVTLPRSPEMELA